MRFPREGHGMTGMKLTVSLLMMSIVTSALADDWPTAMHDARRTGWADQAPEFPLSLNWVFIGGKTVYPDNPDLSDLPYAFAPRFNYTVQPVVLDGKVVVPAMDGNVYCLGLDDGRARWTFSAGKPFLHCASLHEGRAFVGGGDGILYALDLETGAMLWAFDGAAGVAYMSAPCVVDGHVLIGGRNGIFYALDAASGQLRWSHAVGVPILCTAASDGHRVFFGAEDGILYALDLKTGEEQWTFQSMGGSTRHYWPVVAGESVLFRSMLLDGKSEYENLAEDCLKDYVSAKIRADLGLSAEGKLGPEEQKLVDKALVNRTYSAPWDGIEEEYRQLVKDHPREETLYVLDAETGRRRFYAPVGVVARHQDVPPPPIVSRDGDVYVWARTPASSFRRIGFGSRFAHDVMRLDLATGKLSSPMPPKSRKGELRNCTDDYSFLSGAGGYFVGNHGVWGFMPVVEADGVQYQTYLKTDRSANTIDLVFDRKNRWPERDPKFKNANDGNNGRGMNATVIAGNYVLLNNYRHVHAIICWKGASR
jgi:outer membrane protein assembly factor BamB